MCEGCRTCLPSQAPGLWELQQEVLRRNTPVALPACRCLCVAGLQEGAGKAAAGADARGLPAMPAIPALGLYELPQIELPRNWLDIFAPLPAPRPPAPAPGLDAPIQYDQLPALPSGHRKMLQQPGYGQQARAFKCLQCA